MVAFLFWNIRKRPVQRAIANLSKTLGVDVLLLAECEINPAILLSELNCEKAQYHYAPGVSERIQFYSRYDASHVSPSYDEASERITIRHLKPPGLTDILLAACHLPSKAANWDEDSLALMCPGWASAIRDKEKDVGHSRTILVGDFNMNPFESGVIGATAFHAVMSRAIAQRKTRRIQSEDYPFFYNPMWSLFGDATPGPPGTYYWNGSTSTEYFWHILDQVLIRPELLDRFKNDDLRIIESDGTKSLLSSSGLPTESDHLPIFFKLRL